MLGGEDAMDADAPGAEMITGIIVTGTRRGTRVTAPVSGATLSGDDLARASRATLGETLASLPGVSSTAFGPGVSRPVLRGPSALLCGSGLVGGVVNTRVGRVPDRFLNQAFEARAEVVGAQRGIWRATAGIQFVSRDFSVRAAAPLLPPTQTGQFAVFSSHEFNFARVFRKATGHSPYHYGCAQRLLMAHDMAVQDIVSACGFPRHANFSAAFARARGMSPSAFRAYFAL